MEKMEFTTTQITFFKWIRKNFYGKDGIYDYTDYILQMDKEEFLWKRWNL